MNTNDISNRQNVFYWQTDRLIEPKEAGMIWSDRHHYFTDDELLRRANEILIDEKIVKIIPFDENNQVNNSSVNSVRIALLESGKEVIIRAHPKNIRNGYFFVESLAAKIAKDNGIPSYDTLAINEYHSDNDYGFQVIEKMPGLVVCDWLEKHPEDEEYIIYKYGEMLARIHQIKVNGFGPFDNEKAKHGELVGLHSSLSEAVNASLDFNLNVLKEYEVLTEVQINNIKKIYNHNPLLENVHQAVLVHNDYAEWNILTDGKDITAVLDWDECIASDPISDIACWSLFFDSSRLNKLLAGYFSNKEKTSDFNDKFELLRLRYVISKMTLRLRRYSWDKSDFIIDKIEVGKKHLAESLKYFKL